MRRASGVNEQTGRPPCASLNVRTTVRTKKQTLPPGSTGHKYPPPSSLNVRTTVRTKKQTLPPGSTPAVGDQPV